MAKGDVLEGGRSLQGRGKDSAIIGGESIIFLYSTGEFSSSTLGKKKALSLWESRI